MTTRAHIVVEARSWIDTPWHHQASTKGVGSDCIGLVVGVAHRFGLAGDWLHQGQRFHAYAPDPDPEQLLEACALFFDRVMAPQIGDVLLFRLTKHPKHFGIVSDLAPLSIVHAFKTAERVAEMPIDSVWRRRIHSAWRYRGLD